MPLGYLDDAEKTARTFPVIDGMRWSVPGDRARYRADGSIEVLGRDSVTINSGGEKIFAEEVEHALKHHPAVYDAVVAGRAERALGPGGGGDRAAPRGRGRQRGRAARRGARKHLARYKLPEAVRVPRRIQRSPSGKADYRWAREQVSGA